MSNLHDVVKQSNDKNKNYITQVPPPLLLATTSQKLETAGDGIYVLKMFLKSMPCRSREHRDYNGSTPVWLRQCR